MTDGRSRPRKRAVRPTTLLGEYVRRRRLDERLTQAELAEAVNRELRARSAPQAVDRYWISAIERGQWRLSSRRGLPTAEALGTVLDGDPSTILRLAGHTPALDLPSVAAYVACDNRLDDEQRASVLALYEKWNIDVRQAP